MKHVLLISSLLLLVGCSDDEAAATSAGGGGASGDCSACDAPAETGAMFDFLASGSYASWDAESAVHASAGPHGGAVRVYLSPKLSASLGAGNASHTLGGAVVKELYDADNTTLSGWAAWVKTADDSAGGDGIFWYENFSTSSNDAVADDFGEPGCTGCHGGGNDYLLIGYPLQ